MAINLNKSKTHYKVETNKTPIVTTVIIEGTDTDVENLDNQQTFKHGFPYTVSPVSMLCVPMTAARTVQGDAVKERDYARPCIALEVCA